ncbi:MAG: transglutaminase-like domain-containing protein [Candidatus Woesearchaeota archaeon]
MNIKPYFIVLVLFCLISSAYAIDYGDKTNLDLSLTIKNTFTIVATGNSYSIEMINATLNTYPRNDLRQITTSITTNPKTNTDSYNDLKNIEFLYTNPNEGDYKLSLDAKVSTVSMFDEIKMPIKFPVTTLDTELYKYLKPTDIIDVNSDIKNLASELISDKTDLYEIEYVFAEYVRKNIAYDLGTLTSNANQQSSWVLDNRRGVCDEITNLFISLNRASGIPARFVSGVAYTNLDSIFGTSWVSHAWAEVYYPGIGWVPYDVTYGQYGFIDSGHIKLSDSHDSSSSNINYNYLGNNIKLIPGELDIDVEVLKYGENAKARYNFEISSYSSKIGFGSYNLIIVDVINTANYYQVADLYIAETEGMTIIEESKETVLNNTIHRNQVLLKPFQSKTIYWIVKVDENLNSEYVYTLPVTVYNTYNESKTTLIESRDDYTIISYDYFKKLIASKISELEKDYSKYIYLECDSNTEEIYLEDSLDISCILDNKGDQSFKNINICIDNNCSKNDLAVQKLQLEYNKKFADNGLKNIEIKAYNDEFTKASYITINVLDKPSISINEITHPSKITYGEPFEISYTLDKSSASSPKNVHIMLKSETTKIEWNFEELDTAKGFTIVSNGNSLKPNNNEYQLIVSYHDNKGNEYVSEKTFSIESDANFFQNIFLYINLIFSKIERVFV